MEPGQKAFEVFCAESASVGEWSRVPKRVQEGWAAVEAACVPAMPDDVAALVERLEAGLEGVAAGPWFVEGDMVICDSRRQVCCGKGTYECCGNPDIKGDYGPVAQSGGSNARHIANCDPDTIRSLLSALQAQAAEIVRLEDYIERNDYIGGWRARAEAAEAKLREAVEVMQEAYNHLYEINMSNYDHDEVSRLNEGSVNAALTLRYFLSTMEASNGHQ